MTLITAYKAEKEATDKVIACQDRIIEQLKLVNDCLRRELALADRQIECYKQLLAKERG